MLQRNVRPPDLRSIGVTATMVLTPALAEGDAWHGWRYRVVRTDGNEVVGELIALEQERADADQGSRRRRITDGGIGDGHVRRFTERINGIRMRPSVLPPGLTDSPQAAGRPAGPARSRWEFFGSPGRERV